MRKTLLLFLVIFVLLVSCSGNVNPFYIKTVDGVKISANYYETNSNRGIILVHMLGGDKSDWADFVPVLVEEGFNVIAIDLRGHGLSDFDWHSFSDADFAKSVADIEAAKSYLKERGILTYGIVGASIGANIALKYASQDNDIGSVVLLSPSMDYRGVSVSQDIKRYKGSLMIVTSEDDVQSADDSLTLYEEFSGNKGFQIYNSSGHGTNMFVEDNLEEIIISWLRETI